jgi:hypothetical protein
MDFRMWSTKFLMPTFADQIEIVIHNHCTDGRVRFNESDSLPRQFNGSSHHGSFVGEA